MQNNELDKQFGAMPANTQAPSEHKEIEYNSKKENKPESNIESEGYVFIEKNTKVGLKITIAVIAIISFGLLASIFIPAVPQLVQYICIGWFAIIFIVLIVAYLRLALHKSSRVISYSDEKEKLISMEDNSIEKLFSSDKKEEEKKKKGFIEINPPKKMEQRPVVQLDDKNIDPASFYDSTTLLNLLEEMDKALKAKGLAIKAEALASLISAMASSHLLIATSDDIALLEEAIVTIQSYFNTKYVGVVAMDGINQSALVNNRNKVFEGINEARHCFEYVQLLSMKLSSLEDFNTSYPAIYGLASSPKTLHTLDFGAMWLKFEPNLWFVVLTDSYKDIPLELSRCASYLNISVNRIEPISEAYTTMNYFQFAHLIDVAKLNNHMDELYWKRIDKLCDFINPVHEFKIGNWYQNQLEKYVAVAIDLGKKSEEILDEIVSTRIIPGNYSYLGNSIKDKNEGLIPTMESIFGEGDELTLTRQFIKAKSEEQVD